MEDGIHDISGKEQDFNLKNNYIIIKDGLIYLNKEIYISNKGRVVYIYALENDKLFIDLTICKHIFIY